MFFFFQRTDCSGTECECNVHVICAGERNGEKLKTRTSQNATENEVTEEEMIVEEEEEEEEEEEGSGRKHVDRMGEEEEERQRKNTFLSTFNFKRFLMKEDLNQSGVNGCLQDCYKDEKGGGGGRASQGCHKSKECKVKVKCFHDYCVCDLALQCIPKKKKIKT